MSEIVFVDTNILIYAHDVDAGAKRSRAAEKLRQLWESGAGRLSVQVLQEFYVNTCTDSRSEEHTSELQSRRDLVCRLLLEKKNGAQAGTIGPADCAHTLHESGRFP